MKKEIQGLLNLYLMTWGDALTLAWTIRETMRHEDHEDAAFNALIEEIEREANTIKEAEAQQQRAATQPYTIKPLLYALNQQIKTLHQAMKGLESGLDPRDPQRAEIITTSEAIFGARPWARRSAEARLSLADQALRVMDSRWEALGLERLRAPLTERYEGLRQRLVARVQSTSVAVDVDPLHCAIWRAMSYITLYYTRPAHAPLFAALSAAILGFNERLGRRHRAKPVAEAPEADQASGSEPQAV
ncbi:hypothetical protein KKF91_04795 [Myxococcota bacterium]|nr:hypothetical protein [Myxococcota bacterium]MBU1429866.1 hypothetical protein [Myxococcota bacterium]MBU1896456.1 hypothetical protein [Myxococcota bacterium]